MLASQKDEVMDERVRKDVYMATTERRRNEGAVRSPPRAGVGEMLWRRP